MPGPEQTGNLTVVDVYEHNRQAWNREAEAGGPWSIPVDSEKLRAAREGTWTIVLTPNRAVPRDWFPASLEGARILCLAAGGGQQAPVLAATGAEVISFDASDVQLARDRETAERHDLRLETARGDMADLGRFPDECFDLIVNPVSVVFVPDVAPVWRECFRVLRPGGELLSGMMNPAYYLFDHEPARADDILAVRHALPYSNLPNPGEQERNECVESQCTLEFSHTLEALIGGQLRVGFSIGGFYEDTWSDEATLLNRFMPTSFATRARKPGTKECRSDGPGPAGV